MRMVSPSRSGAVPRTDESPVERALGATGPGKPLASVWINPRAFDAEMANNLKSAKGNEAAALAYIIRYWKATDAIVISVALDTA